jgi:hypothetical protein
VTTHQGPWPLDANGTPLPVGDDGRPEFESANWPTVGGQWAPVGVDGRPVVPQRRKMRLPGFVILLGVIAAAVLAFMLPVHDNFGVACPGPGAVGALQADANGYNDSQFTVPSSQYFDASGVNAQIQANADAIITSKVRACHSSGETRLIIAGAILVAAIVGSRFVPDVAQRERAAPAGT